MASPLMTFRMRLTLAVGGLSLALGAAIVFFLSQVASSRITQDQRESLQNRVRAISYALAENLREREREIALLSKTALLTQGDLRGSLLRERLALTKNSYRYYDWLGVAGPDGTVLSAVNGLLEGENVGNRLWFTAGKQGSYIGDVHEAVLLAKKLNNPNPREPLRFVDFSSPILGVDGKLRGVLGSHANWSWVGDVIAGAIGEDGMANGVEIFLIANNKQILYPFTAIGQISVPANLPANHEEGEISWGKEGRFLTAQSTVNPLTATNPAWHVLAGQPMSQALATVHAMHVTLLVAGLIATILFMTLVYRLVSNFCRPLEQLADSAQRVSSGDEHADFHTSSNTREINNLAQALQRMSVTLQARRHALEESYRSLEQKVTERTQELADLYNQAPVGYHAIDRDGVIVQMNDRELHWLGYTRDEVIGKMSIRQLLPADCDAIFLERQQRMLTGEQLPPLNIQLIGKNGRQIPVRTSSSAVLDAAGHFVMSRTAVMDVTEQRELEVALHKQEALSQAIIHATANGLLLYRDDGQCILANKAAAEIIGTSVENLLQQNFHHIDSWKVSGCHAAALQALAGEEVHLLLSTTSSFGKAVDSIVTLIPLQHDGEKLLLVVVKDVSELITANRELEKLARRDALTGLHNRLALNERLREEFLRMKRSGHAYTILMADVDHFKKINDNYGHETGDAVLRRLGQLLLHTVRATDFVARYGGEEFLLLLPDTLAENAIRVAEKLRQTIEAESMPGVGKITLSIGLATARLEDIAEGLALKLADNALYTAKHSGRNCVRSADRPNPATTAGEHMTPNQPPHGA
ncbi:diguanylate cyclase [Aquitalea denitrificans]|uniref:diguanylate cyclase n=1 Tax=Aquitalea denitrificans TaxID=519081 RepID=UPI0013583BF5|nr:diguanylate cyclase [Aquitalea denitrificans]